MHGGCWKLVRDKIGAELELEGRSRRAAPGERERLILAKIIEEAWELAENPSLEEAGDLLEALESWLRLRGWSLEDAARAAREKRAVKGGFNEFYVGLVDKCPRIILEFLEQ